MAEDILEVIEIGLTLRLIEKLGIEKADADLLVSEFIADTRENYGPGRYSIKRGYRRYSPTVVARVRAEYTGRNEDQLRARYGLSRSSFYRLVRKKSR